MNKKNYTNYIFLSFIFVLMVSIIYISILGKKQDEVYYQDQVNYQQAVQLIENQQADEGITLLTQLAEKYPERYQIQRMMGLAYKAKGEFEKSKVFYQRTLDMYPFISEDSLFMLQLGEILFRAGDLPNAKIVLEKCKTLAPTIDEEVYHSTIDQLLAQIKS